MLNHKAVLNIQRALGDLSGEWRGLQGSGERAEEIIRQYNQLLNALLDWEWDAYLDGLDPDCMLPDRLMSRRYLIAVKDPIPPDHAGY
jgi:hypothetical protein